MCGIDFLFQFGFGSAFYFSLKNTVQWDIIVTYYLCDSWVVNFGRPLSTQCEIPWQFPDGSRHSSAALSMLFVTHIMPALVLLSVVGVGMQQCMIQNSDVKLEFFFKIETRIQKID